MMAFAEKLSRNSSSMTDADTQVLRNEGFSDEEIVQIVLAAAARNYLSRTLQALGSDVDDEVGLRPELRAALLEPLLDPRDEAGR
jgi:alkylhydroperoxidase family enzyme